jgi:hypothetical protein
VVARSDGSYLVIAFFETRAQAQGAMLAAAIEAAREGRFGMLASDARGRPEAVGCGEHTHPGIRAVLDVIASALLGGVLPARNHFFDTGSDLTTDDVVRFGAEVEAGHAAVAALAARARADRIVVLLAGLGGKTEIHHLSALALREAASAGHADPSIRR